MDYFFDEASPFKEDFRVMNDINVKLNLNPDIGLPTIIDRKNMSYFQEIMEKRRIKNMMEAHPKYKYFFEILSNCVRGIESGQPGQRTPYQLDDINY